MIAVQDTIETFKTELEGITWQPSGNAATSAFTSVFTAPTFQNDAGSPWCFINDQSPGYEQISTKGVTSVYSKTQSIDVVTCYQNLQEVVTQEELYERVRYIVEAVELLAVDDTFITSLGYDDVQLQNSQDNFVDELNVVTKTHTFLCTNILQS